MRPVAVLGLGVMGGSLVRALSAAGQAGTPVRCWSPDPGEVRSASALPGVEPLPGAGAVAGCAGVILATPLSAMPGLLDRMAPALEADAWLQDVGSLQRPVLEWMAAAGLAPRAVSAHPLAGSERSGFAASSPDLYRDAPVYLSPGQATPATRAAVSAFWEGLGARPETVDPDEHDRRMAWVSHLPQLVSAVLADTLREADVSATELGPGGRDTTRLAGSDPGLWRDILAHGDGTVVGALRRVARGLGEQADALESGDADLAATLLERTRGWRSA